MVTSLASLANAAQRLLTSRTYPRLAAEEWRRRCAFALTSAMAFDDRKGDDWCTHLHYDALMADPVDAVRGLYGHFGETVSQLHARRMRAFLQDRPPDCFGRHRYDPADFGWTYAGLDEEFRQYVGRYGVKTARGCEGWPAGHRRPHCARPKIHRCRPEIGTPGC